MTPSPIPSPNLTVVNVAIRGTRPLWQHRFGPDALPLTPQERTGVAGNDPEEWRKTCLVLPDGRLYVTGSYLFAAIREGGKYLKKGRGSLMTNIAATLILLDDIIPIPNRAWPGFGPERAEQLAQTGTADLFDPATAVPPPADPAQPVYLDIRGVKNPSTRARNIRYRVACAAGWEMAFTIQFDKTLVSREQMHSAIIQAGALVGVGNGRAIGMGRFEVTAFGEG